MRKSLFFSRWMALAILAAALLVLHSCKVKEYPYMARSNMPGDRTPVYYTDKYDGVKNQQRYQDGRHYSNGVAAVKQNDRWGFIDAEANVVIPMDYAWVSSYGEYGFHEKLAMAKTEFDKYKMPILAAGPTFLINQKGQRVTPIYNAMTPVARKLAQVNNGTKFVGVGKQFSKSDGKWGFIDKFGKEVVKCKYDIVYPFRDIVTFVQNDGKWGCINESGKEIIPCQYDEAYYKSDFIDVNTPFDMSEPGDLTKKEIAEMKNFIYMVSDGKVFLFDVKGKLLSKFEK